MDLYEDETETDDPTLVGENCHIVAESDDGPRADASMPLDRRNGYSNLILLCRNHHKVIDSQENEYTVERLHRMKADHEAWIRQQLGFDPRKQHDDEQYAGMVDAWARLAHLDKWLGWSSYILSHGQPRMSVEVDTDLEELRRWLLNRIWPDRYAALQDAFENFRRVLQDFQETFRNYAEQLGGTNVIITRRFYQIDEWNEERYDRLAKRYNFHVDLVQDLMLELTRAANLICDHVRQHLMYSYRRPEGHLMVQTGMDKNLAFHEFVVRYRPEERDHQFPYPGLDTFMLERENRDFQFGKGSEP